MATGQMQGLNTYFRTPLSIAGFLTDVTLLKNIVRKKEFLKTALKKK